MEGGVQMIPKVELTSKGAALLAKVPEGQTAQVTRWQIGTGALPLAAVWTGRRRWSR